MKQITKIQLTLLLLLALVTQSALMAQGRKATPAEEKFSVATFIINRFYVDTVNEAKLLDEALKAMLKELDPHSEYMNPEEVKAFNETMSGNFDGIGIQFNMLNDTLFVVQAVSGGPAEKVGMRAGDKIVSVGDTCIAGVKMDRNKIMKMLRGPKGTVANVKVMRNGEAIDFAIVRDKIPLYSLDASYMVDDRIGYIRLNRFMATTNMEFLDALDTLKQQGMKKLILDLSGNGGGALQTAIDLTDEFISDSRTIVYTEGRALPREDANATDRGNFEEGDLVIMVDETSASASEIVSGALQDWDRAVIVGRRTFGKGLVQRAFPLPDGSQLKLTLARYYTPSGRCVQKPFDNADKYRTDLLDRYKHGELMHADSIRFADSLKYETLTAKRIVYGGGGIMPDVFVPLDTTGSNNYLRDLYAKNILIDYQLDYIDNHREEILAEYKDFKHFKERFEVTDSMIEDLVERGRKQQLEPKEGELEQILPELKTAIKALTARNIWDSSAFYQIYNERNAIYKKSVEILSDGKQYKRLLSPAR